MKIFKRLVLAAALTLGLAALVHADYYRGNTVKPHGHSSNTDGGVITNLSVTGSVSAGGNISFSSTSYVSAARTNLDGNQSLTSGAWTVVTFPTEENDNLGEFNGSTFTAINAGRYEFHGCAAYAANATGSRFVRITLTGTGAYGIKQIRTFPPGANGFSVCLDSSIRLPAGGTLIFEANQSSGGALNVLGNNSFGTPAPETTFNISRTN